MYTYIDGTCFVGHSDRQGLLAPRLPHDLWRRNGRNLRHLGEDGILQCRWPTTVVVVRCQEGASQCRSSPATELTTMQP